MFLDSAGFGSEINGISRMKRKKTYFFGKIVPCSVALNKKEMEIGGT